MKKTLLITMTLLMFSAFSANAADSNFFIKANVGVSKLNKTGKFNSDSSSFISAGIGYNVMDNVRADLVFDHFIDPAFKRQGKRTKAKVNTFLLNGYIDLVDISITKMFVGAGAGIAQVKIRGINFVDAKSKQANNFSYAAYAGVSTEFAPSFHGELVYSWRDFAVQKASYYALKGHQVAVGVRFDI